MNWKKWVPPALPALLVISLGGASCARAGVGSAPSAEPTSAPLEAGAATPEENELAASLLGAARSAFADKRMAEADSLARLVVERHGTTPSSTPALLLSARTAEALGDLEAAVQRADRYAGLFPPGSQAARPAQELARRARSRLAEERASRPVIGAMLPRSGSAYMQRYGDLILQGIRIALGGGGEEGPVRLVVVDDGGDPGSAPERMAELERSGAVAVIGPLLTPAVRAAAEARGSESIVIVSPTAPDSVGAPNTYSLGGMDAGGPAALARYAAAHELRRVAVLYPRMTHYAAAAAVFEAALRAAGGQVSVDVPYDSGATTFADWVGRVVKSAPQAVYVPAPERDVRQLAPQLRYYGISPDTVQVMGDESWTSDAVRRTLQATGMTGVLASTPMVRAAPGSGWQAFTQVYEQAERRTLDNPYPALGYDAALLVLRAVQESRSHGGSVASRFAALRDVQGATGTYSVQGGSIRRRPVIVRVEADRLVPMETVAEGGGQR